MFQSVDRGPCVLWITGSTLNANLKNLWIVSQFSHIPWDLTKTSFGGKKIQRWFIPTHLLPHTSTHLPSALVRFSHALRLHFLSAVCWQRLSEGGCRQELYYDLLIYLNTILFNQDTLHWSKMIVKTFTMLQKISSSNICSSFEWSIHQKISKKYCWNTETKKHEQHNCFQHR